MSPTWFFIIGMPVGGLAIWLFYVGRIRELHQELDQAKRQ